MNIRGVELEVRDEGDGTAFLWGHGLLSSMAQEDRVGAFDWGACADVARLVRYDARGHGRSQATPDAADYRWSHLARDMLALADAVSPDEPVIVGGASMGAGSAIHAAVAEPDRVAGLVLAIPPTAWETRPMQSRLYRTGARLIAAAGPRPFVALLRRMPLPSIFREELADVRDAALDELATGDRRVLPVVLRGASQSDLPSFYELVALEVPTLLMAWEGDPGHPVSTAETLHDLFQDSELHVARRPADVRRWPALVREFVEGLA